MKKTLRHILRHGELVPYEEGTLRTASISPMRYVVVTPAGHFSHAQIASNITNPVVMRDGAKIYVTPSAHEQGYRALHEVCDSPDECERLYQYFDWEIERGGKVEPMPEKYIPSKVLEMRRKAGANPQFEWDTAAPPMLGGPVADPEPEASSARAPRRRSEASA
jgi:hypothetical protein